MVYCVQATLAFQNASRRNTISSAIQTRIGQLGVAWGPVTRVDHTDEQGRPAVFLTVRFSTQAAADTFWTDMIAAVGTGVNGPLPGSEFYRHNCAHDEGEGEGCEITEQVVF